MAPRGEGGAGPLLGGGGGAGALGTINMAVALLGACKPDKETAGETPVCSFSLLPTHSTALPSGQDTYSPSNSGCLH